MERRSIKAPRAVRSHSKRRNWGRKGAEMKHMLKSDLLKQLIPVALIAVAAVFLVTPALAGKRQSAWVAVNSTSGATATTTLVVQDNLVFSGPNA